MDKNVEYLGCRRVEAVVYFKLQGMRYKCSHLKNLTLKRLGFFKKVFFWKEIPPHISKTNLISKQLYTIAKQPI